MRTETALLKLLSRLRSLESSRDRDRIAESVVMASIELLEARFGILYAVRATSKGLSTVPMAWAVVEGDSATADVDNVDGEEHELAADPLFEDALLNPSGIGVTESDGMTRMSFRVGEASTPVAVFEAQANYSPSEAILDCVSQLLNIYSDHLGILDYAELDTLTKLHNRKTFDENFDRFIEIAEQARRGTHANSEHQAESPSTRECWLAVVDIDRFKRINDNFGHLFGDEVLLRVAELMKKSFRGSDKLFRFGGEEFVVLLRHVSPDMAETVLDRFRKAVETHEFPQVGQVTCSMGYVCIDPALTPAEILGQADEALYFSKENGRNQINRYETLVEKGLLAPSVPTANADLQADIDALFD